MAMWGLLNSEMLMKPVATWEGLLEVEGHLSPLPLSTSQSVGLEWVEGVEDY